MQFSTLKFMLILKCNKNGPNAIRPSKKKFSLYTIQLLVPLTALLLLNKD